MVYVGRHQRDGRHAASRLAVEYQQGRISPITSWHHVRGVGQTSAGVHQYTVEQMRHDGWTIRLYGLADEANNCFSVLLSEESVSEGNACKVHHHAVGHAVKVGETLAHATEGRDGPTVARAARVAILSCPHA